MSLGVNRHLWQAWRGDRDTPCVLRARFRRLARLPARPMSVHGLAPSPMWRSARRSDEFLWSRRSRRRSRRLPGRRDRRARARRAGAVVLRRNPARYRAPCLVTLAVVSPSRSPSRNRSRGRGTGSVDRRVRGRGAFIGRRASSRALRRKLYGDFWVRAARGAVPVLDRVHMAEELDPIAIVPPR